VTRKKPNSRETDLTKAYRDLAYSHYGACRPPYEVRPERNVKTDRRFCEACEVDYCFVNIQLSGVDHTSRKRERQFLRGHPSLTVPARNRSSDVDEARPTVTNGVYRRGCNRLKVPRGTLGLAKLGKPNVPRGTLGITNLGMGGNRPLPNGDNRLALQSHEPAARASPHSLVGL
jgi:hypothetical protein